MEGLKTVSEVRNANRRFGGKAEKFRLQPRQAFDIQLGYDLLPQASVLNYILAERPGLVIISAPCDGFSVLNHLLSNFRAPDLNALKLYMHRSRRQTTSRLRIGGLRAMSPTGYQFRFSASSECLLTLAALRAASSQDARHWPGTC